MITWLFPVGLRAVEADAILLPRVGSQPAPHPPWTAARADRPGRGAGAAGVMMAGESAAGRAIGGS